MPNINDLVTTARNSKIDINSLFAIGDQLNNAGDRVAYVELFKAWIIGNPDDKFLHLALYNYAVAISGEDIDAAILTLQYALKVKADYYPIYINLAAFLEKRGRNDLAFNILQELFVSCNSITAETIEYKLMAINQMGRIQQTANNYEDAELSFEQSLSINENQPLIIIQWLIMRQKQCKWPLFPQTLSKASKERRIRGIAPLTLAYYIDDPLFQLANAYRYNKEVARWTVLTPSSSTHNVPRDPPKRLRIGYVSSDFRAHAVGYSMTEVIELHDRSKFEIFGYYIGSVRQTDETQQRIKTGVDQWIDLFGMDDQSVADRIRKDGIHILVDLNGYTMDARTRVFSMLPAPINVNWFGYPGTMGSPHHHYIIADEFVIPEGYKRYYSEKVLYLPCYQPNDRKRVVSNELPSRDQYCLPKEGFVFCSFNGLQKLNLCTFKLWMRILQEVPGSVLWLLGDTAIVNERLLQLATTLGVSRDRIVFAKQVPNAVHLARYVLADLFLDSLPYGAHTTAADSMWMGVPLVTIAGAAFPARVCASLMRAAGIEELVATDQDDYLNKAVSLGRDPQLLQEYKDRLIKNRHSSVLFDTPRLVLNLENLYQQMWVDYVKGFQPKPDLGSLDVYGEVAFGVDHETNGLINWRAHLDSYSPFP